MCSSRPAPLKQLEHDKPIEYDKSIECNNPVQYDSNEPIGRKPQYDGFYWGRGACWNRWWGFGSCVGDDGVLRGGLVIEDVAEFCGAGGEI